MEPYRILKFDVVDWRNHEGPALVPAPAIGERLDFRIVAGAADTEADVAVYAREHRVGRVSDRDVRRVRTLASRPEVRASVAQLINEKVVTGVLEAEVPEVLRKLNTPLPLREGHDTPLAQACAEGRLLTMRPTQLTAAGQGADADAAIGFFRWSGQNMSIAPRYDGPDTPPPTWPAKQRVYLVREPAIGRAPSRVSVILPGSRHLGYLDSFYGEMLLKDYRNRSPGELWRAVLPEASEPEPRVGRSGFPEVSISLYKTLLRTYRESDDLHGGASLSGPLLPEDIYTLGPGVPADWRERDAAAREVVPEERRVDFVEVPAIFPEDASKVPPAIRHLPADPQAGIRYLSSDLEGLPRGVYDFADEASPLTAKSHLSLTDWTSAAGYDVTSGRRLRDFLGTLPQNPPNAATLDAPVLALPMAAQLERFNAWYASLDRPLIEAIVTREPPEFGDYSDRWPWPESYSYRRPFRWWWTGQWMRLEDDWLAFVGAHSDLSGDDHLRDSSAPVAQRRNELEPDPELVHPLVYYREIAGDSDDDAGVLVLAGEAYGPSLRITLAGAIEALRYAGAVEGGFPVTVGVRHLICDARGGGREKSYLTSAAVALLRFETYGYPQVRRTYEVRLELPGYLGIDYRD